jgi:hypothetical protein
LFGIVDKSERSKETLIDAPVPALTAKVKGFTELVDSARGKSAETWAMRIIQPGKVTDGVFEAEDSKTASASPFGLWKTTATAGTPTVNDPPQVSIAPMPVPEPPAPEPPAAPKKDEPKN